MRVSYIDNQKIINLNLPSTVWGNYWVKDSTDEEGQNIINIQAKDDKWIMNSNMDTSIIYNGIGVTEIALEMNKFYTLVDVKTRDLSFVYTSDVYDDSYEAYEASSDSCVIKVGRSQDADIVFSNSNVEEINNEIFYQNGKWAINDLKSRFGTYVNNRREESRILENGDFVFIMGLKIIVMNKELLINNPSNQVRVNQSKLMHRMRSGEEVLVEASDVEPSMVDLYNDKDFFIRSPRFKTNFEPVNIKIDEPPEKKEQGERPAILIIGPMLTMSLMSLGMLLPVVQQLMNGQTTMGKAWPRLLMSGGMLLGMLLWPILNSRYAKKQAKIYEATRQKKYRQYVDFKVKRISELGAAEKSALIDNNVSPDDCAKIILQKNRRLWERDINHNDFMQFRLGVGNAPLSVHVETPGEKFSLEDDSLKSYLSNTVKNHSILAGVPIIESFVKKNIIAVEGKRELIKNFVNNILIQAMAYHSYKDLKVILLTSELYANDWQFIKTLPHAWSDDKKTRFFATTAEEMKNISFYLEQIVKARFAKPESGENSAKEKFSENEKYKAFGTYYLIITDNYKVARNLQAVENIISHGGNYGFSFLILGDNLSNAPPECKGFISIGEKTSGLFESELIANKQKIFSVDKSSFNMESCVNTVANIPIEMGKGEYSLPNTISFLQMYKAGMIEQLNPVNRWKKNNPVISLSAPVGIGTNGELFKLDLHEKFHGPHGLVAGMTGSGKSEWIISYILSMACNFHPDEVQFVLIDYKGGGLAGAFENRETGVRLPHLIGTITNLDVSEINRSLVSINSELKRRQAAFNKARDKLGEGTIDIYKYQRYYREGALDEPISHLFIISDEFAELKAQQPEFMDELISTARIGRSLGVHLILATQKPSGVVNDQIWSNSRFRICLKVQDASDSKEMIKRPDAAALKQAGRFYLQVGYDEFFALGQSAWTGAQYIPSSKVVKQIDDSLEFVDQTGNVIKTVNNSQEETIKKSLGEELPNIVKFLTAVADHENVHPKRLWLDRIPQDIYIGNLQKKYDYKPVAGEIKPVIGEYDIPTEQSQQLLTLDLKKASNMWLVGLSNKDMFYRAVIFSTMTIASPEDVNMYVLDFDTEALRIFQGAPQVGDVVVATEKEKVQNWMRMLDEEKDARRKLLKDYNGSYDYYLEKSGKKLPLIVSIITSFENFVETYPELEDWFRSYTRDSVKFGIKFLIGSIAENGVRSQIRQNFNTRFVLDVSDVFDYRSILGIGNKIVPSRGAARGVCAFDDIGLEFQTAQFCLKSQINEFVADIINKLKAAYKTKAKRIPVLPEIINADNFDTVTYEEFPLGIYTGSLHNATVNLGENPTFMMASDYAEQYKPLIKPMVDIATKGGFKVFVLDPLRLVDYEMDPNIHMNGNFAPVIDEIQMTVMDAMARLKNSNYDLNVVKDMPKYLLIIRGVAEVTADIGNERAYGLAELFKQGAQSTVLGTILMETSDSIKALRYDDRVASAITNKSGAYVGPGIDASSAFAISVMDRSLRDMIPTDYGYIIDKGRPYRLKYAALKKEDE